MRPMLATPTLSPPRGEEWRHEIKWDGIRALVNVTAGQVTVTTRSGSDCSRRFPEITESHLKDFDDLVLDGEIVGLIHGTPNFRAVMHRLSPGGYRGHRGGTTPQDEDQFGEAEIQFMAFDVLRAAGHGMTSLPWHARRALLEGAGIAQNAIVVPPAHRDGDALFTATAEQGLEGIVSKRVDAPYRPGVRSDEWLKCVHRKSETYVVGGWRPVSGASSTIGSILIGTFTEGQLRFRSRVGTGISPNSSAALLDILVPAPHCPFRQPDDNLSNDDLIGTHWVKPTTVVEISYLGDNPDGRLRQPSFKGLRLDLGIPRG